MEVGQCHWCGEPICSVTVEGAIYEFCSLTCAQEARNSIINDPQNDDETRAHLFDLLEASQ